MIKRMEVTDQKRLQDEYNNLLRGLTVGAFGALRGNAAAAGAL